MSVKLYIGVTYCFQVVAPALLQSFLVRSKTVKLDFCSKLDSLNHQVSGKLHVSEGGKKLDCKHFALEKEYNVPSAQDVKYKLKCEQYCIVHVNFLVLFQT